MRFGNQNMLCLSMVRARCANFPLFDESVEVYVQDAIARRLPQPCSGTASGPNRCLATPTPEHRCGEVQVPCRNFS